MLPSDHSFLSASKQYVTRNIHNVAHAARHHCSELQGKLNTATIFDDIVQWKPLIYAVFFAAAFLWFSVAVTQRILHRRRQSTTRPSTPNLEKRSPLKATEREPGVWPPSTFTRPTAPAYPDFSLHETNPLPYRPFRYGPKYHITMGLRRMNWDSWIELDKEWDHFHDLKTERIASRGNKCVRTSPEAFDAACELLQELGAYLCERYPGVFRWTDRGAGVELENLHTKEKFDIAARPLPCDPLAIAARWIQDDLAIMIERPDGQYYLLGGAILLAGFWRLSDKFGMSLADIHFSGDVPGFKEKLQTGMERFFKRLRPEEPVERNNYFVQVDEHLDWSSSIGGEDLEGIGWNTAEKNRAIEHHYFRSERQTLRRLPKTGAIIFTIRTYFHPITQIAQEPYVPGRLASAVRSWGDDVSRYKGREKYGEVLLEYLDEMHAKQVEGGLKVTEDGEEDREKGFPW